MSKQGTWRRLSRTRPLILFYLIEFMICTAGSLTIIPVSFNTEHLSKVWVRFISSFSFLLIPVYPLSRSKVVISIVVIFWIQLLPEKFGHLWVHCVNSANVIEIVFGRICLTRSKICILQTICRRGGGAVSNEAFKCPLV